MDEALKRIRATADYQFGKGTGAKLFPNNVEIEYSRNTGRLRYIYLDGKRLATLRPTDGLFSLSIEGARCILENPKSVKCCVKVRKDVSKFIAEGGDVFAVHVVKVNNDVRAKDEVIVVDDKGRLLAVGRAVLSAAEMPAFKIGVAVKVRRGVAEER